MVDYVKSRATSLRLLTKFGASATLRRLPVGVQDPLTGIVTLGAPIDVAVKAVLLDFIYRTFGVEVQDKTMISASDKRILMSASVVPTMRDHVIFAGEEYNIVNIKQVAPSGYAVLYDLWVRQ